MSGRKCLAGLLVAVALLAFVGPVAAGEPCVPFKAVGITTSEDGPYPGPGPNQMTLYVAGEGQATHLGNLTSVATVVMTLDEVAPGVWVPVWFEGDVTMVAANGDELYMCTFGVPTPAGGVGGYEIVGGTGRFEDATGSGLFEKSEGLGLFDGEICFVPGKRSGKH